MCSPSGRVTGFSSAVMESTVGSVWGLAVVLMLCILLGFAAYTVLDGDVLAQWLYPFSTPRTAQ